MPDPLLPAIREVLAASTEPADTLLAVLKLTGQYLAADRCFLYVRDPAAGRGRIALVWRRHPGIPDPTHEWQDDTTDLPQEDPLFRAALAARPSVFVEDVETAPPTMLNREFEHKTFGHRALIHAHITEGETLWGILQPCLFGAPRHWTDDERTAVESILPLLVAPIKAYMQGVSTS